MDVVPVDDSTRTLSLMWTLDPSTPQNNMDNYIAALSDLIGDEGEGKQFVNWLFLPEVFR